MGEGYNRVLLFGNLGADPELKMTSGGTSVLKLRMATTERYCDKNNVWQDKTEWHSVTVWGKRGESLHKILSKGSTIFVEGSLHTSSYEKDGEKRYRTEVIAKSVILGGRNQGGDSGGSQRQERPAREAPASDDGPPPDLPEDDLPF